MKFSTRGGVRIAGVVLSVLLTSATVQAKQLLDVNLVSRGTAVKFSGEKVQTDKGFGWRSGSTKDIQADNDGILYKIKPGVDIDLASGSIDISVQRSRDGGPEWDSGTTYNTLFAILGPNNKRLLVAYVLWDFRGDHSVSGVAIDSAFGDVRQKLWGSWIPFNRKIALGEWVDLKFSWGAGNTKILVDGEEVGRYYSDYDGIENKPTLPVVPGGISLSDYLQDARELMIGSDIDHINPVLTRKRTQSFGLYNSTIGRFVITDSSDAAVAPTIAALENDAFRVVGFSGSLTPGNVFGVTMHGTPGGTGTFDIAYYTDRDTELSLDWRGFGVYLEEKAFYEPGEVNLRDVEGYKVYVSTSPLSLPSPGIEPLESLDVKEQSYTVQGLERDTAYYCAVIAEMRDGTLKVVSSNPTKLPMTETSPGVYAGSRTISWQDRFPNAVVVGRLVSATVETTLVDTKFLTIDPSLKIDVATEPSELKADEKSTSKVTVTVTDANGNPVSGHKVKFLLATNSQYTGVVGGGAFKEQVGGALKETSFSKTDLFGRITTTYVAGFAAKTAVIVARDMVSNSTGAGYVKTFIQASAELKLLPVNNPAADAGYQITVTSSDAWLTADGKSQARITARVTRNGNPVDGHAVSFSVSSGGGSIRKVSDTTDRRGEARAVYTAGKKIGLVLVSATDTTAGISGSVQIELRSDAPAKIVISIKPESLPADGRSTAELLVQITDINDNPNDNTEVEYLLAGGGGRIRNDKGVTDRNGESSADYTAGTTPGTVRIEITVRSQAPTDEELAKAQDLILAVTDYDFF